MKKLHITITTITIIIQIFTIVALVYLNIHLIALQTTTNLALNKTITDFDNKLANNQQRNDDKMLELTSNLANTRKSLASQIEQLKAETTADFSGIIPTVLKGVVSVATDVAQGSGFIISKEGYIVTNAHVLSGGHYVRILPYQSDKWISAELIGYDLEMDVAVLKITSAQNYLEFENSDNVQIGEKVIALGNPLGLSFSVSEGIISARDREGINNLNAYFQVDVPLNSGNSGGPLVNKEGKVVGINNFKLQNSENLGFSLESNYAKNTINKILKESTTIQI